MWPAPIPATCPHKGNGTRTLASPREAPAAPFSAKSGWGAGLRYGHKICGESSYIGGRRCRRL